MGEGLAMTKSRSGAIVATVLGGLIGAASNASGAVLPQFSLSPTTIIAGESSELDLTLQVVADSGYFNAKFVSGSVTLNSGTGLSQSFSIAPNTTTQNFSFSFAYPTAGTFNPSFSFTVLYSEQYQSYQQTGYGSYWVNSGYYYSYSCGLFRTCTGYQDTSHYEYYPIYGYVTNTTTQSASGQNFGALLVNEAVAAPLATPVPAALPLFASTLIGGGVIAWRRKRKRQAEAIPA
jgi:hypothetical protein